MIWNRLYKLTPSAERGTMYQLRNLIHRTNVPGDPERDRERAIGSQNAVILMLRKLLLLQGS